MKAFLQRYHVIRGSTKVADFYRTKDHASVTGGSIMDFKERDFTTTELIMVDVGWIGIATDVIEFKIELLANQII